MCAGRTLAFKGLPRSVQIAGLADDRNFAAMSIVRRPLRSASRHVLFREHEPLQVVRKRRW